MSELKLTKHEPEIPEPTYTLEGLTHREIEYLAALLSKLRAEDSPLGRVFAVVGRDWVAGKFELSPVYADCASDDGPVSLLSFTPFED